MVAGIALFAALDGTVYAAAEIDGHAIKLNRCSVEADDLKRPTRDGQSRAAHRIGS